ncbi:hypothetical protein NC653_035752 [Populus alba x Populus x berolinensis]|uniref:Uncharacterized protein n=1 Tax=Populus alba x Populus x berolinensis TaxID=444605 RepID=A0AAD6LIE8_9ROSI|nr:hypothetical protein NC653_035752 [Populus alba x Populus x berolinensis]
MDHGSWVNDGTKKSRRFLEAILLPPARAYPGRATFRGIAATTTNQPEDNSADSSSFLKIQNLVNLVDDVDTYGDGEEDVADDEDRAGVFQSVTSTFGDCSNGLEKSGKGWRQLSCIDIQILEKQIRWCAASIRRFE